MNLKQQAKNSFFWSILIQLSSQMIGFVVSIILARQLLPKDFGIIGLVTIFIVIGRVIIDGGMTSSLIRNKEVSQKDYSTVFIINIFVALFFYIITYLSAPLISNFFKVPELIKLLRVYSIVFILSSLTLVQSTRLNKNLQFKTQFKLAFPSLIISSLISIWMAYNGFGIWSLVYKEIIFAGLASLQIWIYAKWTPSMVFDYKCFKYHFNYGYKLLLTDLFSKIFSDSYLIVIGKFFSTTQLGLFTRATTMVELPNSIIFNSINRVMFPLLANINEDDERLKSVYRRIISTVSFIVVPVLILMAVLAKPLFIFLLTEKWVGAVPYFQIVILSGMISPLQSYNLNICKVKGRSDLVLKLSFFEYGLISIGIFCGFWFGIYGLLWSLVFVSIAKVVITSFYAGILINYTPKQQFIDVYSPFLYCTISALPVYFLNVFYFYGFSNNLSILLLGASVFVSSYFFMSYLFKNEIFFSGVNAIKSKILKTNSNL
ncbi:MAG: lipopolysaccharide biosynthesis protein [Flavobacterium sp.]|nr:lipopolysaccharide biosynthesis protein [Flavobacterium sp.]